MSIDYKHPLRWLLMELRHQYIRSFVFPKFYKIYKQYKISDVKNTLSSLINSNRSMSRFGDGELGWIIQKDVFSGHVFLFEKNSNKLSNRLKQVLSSNIKGLEIGLPSYYEAINGHHKKHMARSFKLLMCQLGVNWMKCLRKNKQYYAIDITRPYSSYINRSDSKYVFHQLKRIWQNKDLLIVEGRGTRLGVKNDLFNGARSIHRIECPITNAFESYDNILNETQVYLNHHPNYLTLVSLGPAATILAYDLCKLGYRTIDIGHLDIEYEWFLRHKICDIPYKFVNEIKGGEKIAPIHDKIYKREIIKNVY